MDQRPDGVILDLRLGDYRDDQFKGLDILKRIVVQHPQLPVLMFTQYSQDVERDTVARSALQSLSQKSKLLTIIGANGD